MGSFSRFLDSKSGKFANKAVNFTDGYLEISRNHTFSTLERQVRSMELGWYGGYDRINKKFLQKEILGDDTEKLLRKRQILLKMAYRSCAGF